MFVCSPIGAERRVARLIKESATLIEQAESLLNYWDHIVFSASIADDDHVLDGPLAKTKLELIQLLNCDGDVTAVASSCDYPATQPLLNTSDKATTDVPIKCSSPMRDPASADEDSDEASSATSDTASSAGSDDTPSDDAVSLYAFLCVL